MCVKQKAEYKSLSKITIITMQVVTKYTEDFRLSFILSLDIIVELTAKSLSITINKLVKLSASGGLSCLTPPGSFAVSDLVTCDLPVLPVKWRGLPPKQDALRRENTA